MHNFYRAIGFSGNKNSKQEINKVINDAVNEYIDNHFDDTKGNLVEIFVQVNKSMGIAIHAEIEKDKKLDVEYAFPFVKVKQFDYYENILVERNVSTYSYSAECDNKENGVMIIFYLQNCLDYVNYKMPEKTNANVGFSGLCLSGKILLPSMEYEEYNKNYQKIRQNKNKLITEAQNGNENAMEDLTIDEMNLYTRVMQRMQKEDILSIVDTCFMPYGMECDRYTVIGKIIGIEKCVNRFTGENIYNMLLECNNVIINVAINENDLYGVPKIGRRFKGNIWLQGRIDFNGIASKK